MARKKTAKTAKTKMTKSAKKTTIKNTSSNPTLITKMEKEFRAMPAKLVAQYRQDISQLKGQEAKLKTEIQKAQALNKAIQKKQAVLAQSKNKTKPTIKKQIVSTKKAFDLLTKSIKSYIVKLEQISRLRKSLATKQSVFASLSSQLKKFEKELLATATATAKSSKATKTTKSVKKTMKRTKKAQNTTNTQTSPVEKTTTEQEIEAVEMN